MTWTFPTSITVYTYGLIMMLTYQFCDSSSGDSLRLITGSADQTAKLWNVQTGAQLYSFNFDSPARAVDFAVGDKLAVITTDPFMELPSAIHVKRISKDPSERGLKFILCYDIFFSIYKYYYSI